MKGVEVEVVDGSFATISADTYVVPIPSNERPLRGYAGKLDWRMCGILSEEILSGNLSGAPHEAVLLPGRPPITALRVMLLGIGAAELQPGRGVQDAFRELSSRLLALCTERAVVALPGAIDLAQDAEPALRGCLQSMSSFRGEGVLRLAIPGGRKLVRALRSAANELAEDAQRRHVKLIIEAPPEPQLTPRSIERIL